jgi:hypothetical protein
MEKMNPDSKEPNGQYRITSYYVGLTGTLSTKNGLSSGAVIGLSSLLDELPEFRRRKNDRQSLKNVGA